jgi:DNA repair protein RadA/Sms
VVLQLEGDRYGGFKILRSVKNRFGSTNEAGIFEMVESGLEQVKNPSAALLAERQVTDGSVVLATMEGSRPILVEVQALVNKTSYGYPKRTASGMELTRLNLLVAMAQPPKGCSSKATPWCSGKWDYLAKCATCHSPKSGSPKLKN